MNSLEQDLADRLLVQRLELGSDFWMSDVRLTQAKIDHYRQAIRLIEEQEAASEE